MAVRAVAPPPALIDHFDAGDDLIRVKGNLGVVSCEGRAVLDQGFSTFLTLTPAYFMYGGTWLFPFPVTSHSLHLNFENFAHKTKDNGK